MDNNGILSTFFSSYQPHTYLKGDTILEAGAENTYIYYLHSGFIQSSLITGSGLSFTLNIYSKNATFPLSQVLAGITHNPYFFNSISTSVIYKAPKKDVMTFFQTNAQASLELSRRLSVGLEGFVARIMTIVKASARQKVVLALHMLSQKFGEHLGDGSIAINFKHTHQDIADIAGISRETATKELIWLQNNHILKNERRQTVILSPKALLSLAEDADLATSLPLL